MIPEPSPRKAIVLFSGGQDSTTCLAWALDRYSQVETVGFDYGQRHVIELECRLVVLARFRDRFPQWAARLGEDHLLDIGVLGEISDTALTQEAEIVLQADGLPSTFVPGRNLLFLTLAAALAYRRGCTVLVGGMSQTDYSGYPDCRDETMKAMQAALSLGMARPLEIETPLMWIDKARTWELAAELGGEALVEIIRQDTHTCYLGDREHRHPWGLGCGSCPACELRAEGYQNWRMSRSPQPESRRARPQAGRLEVPIIDIGRFEQGDAADRQRIARQVDQAAREVGFMQVVGHGIDRGAIDGLAAAIDEFFAQPAALKQRTRPESPHVNRGYSGPRTERLSYSLGVTSAADLFEAFNIGSQARDFPELALSERDYPDNLWPETPATFRARIERWFAEAGGLARRMTRLFACALGLPDDYFVPFQDHSIDTLRLNHYAMPDADLALEPGQMGMGGHTDYGIVTVLWADRVSPGLQILDGDGRWHDVMPAPGALLINLGDMLARWTNDRWMSTMHRVLPPIGPDGRLVRRRSAAFFHDGNADAVISCLSGCTDDAHPPLYQPITVGEHLAAKLAGSRALQVNEQASREGARLLRAERRE